MPLRNFPHDAVTIEGCGPSNRVTVPALASLQAVALSGLVWAHGRPLLTRVGDEAFNLRGDEADQAAGEWYGVFVDPTTRTHVVMADPLAFQPVFWSVSGTGEQRRLHAANSFQGVLASLRQFGVSPQVEWEVVVPWLMARHTIMMQGWTDSTMAQGVHLLPPDRVLVAGREGISTAEKTFLFDPQGRSYEELIDLGIECAVQQAKTVAALPVDKRIYLSGGRDSRCVLGILAQAGDHTEYGVVTADPRTGAKAAQSVLQRDLELADVLRGHYGMSWAVDGHHEKHGLTWRQSVDWWQGFRSQRDTAFPAADHVFWPVDVRVETRGGGGELTREVWTKHLSPLPIWQQLSRTPGSLERDVDMLYQWLVPPHGMDPLLHEGGRRHFRDSMRAPESGDDFMEALDRQYPYYRNRFHFGHALQSRARNAIVFLPLAQRAFLQAASVAGMQARASGQVTFDIARRLDPDLTALPLEYGTWDHFRKALPSTQRGRWRGGQSSDLEGFYARESANHRMRSGGQWLTARRRYAFETKEMSNAQIAAHVDHIVREVPGGSDCLTDPLLAIMNMRLRQNSLIARHTVSKLDTVMDVVAERDHDVEHRRFSVDPVRVLRERSVESARGLVKQWGPDLREKPAVLTPLQLRTALSVTNHVWHVVATWSYDRPVTVEFAWDLQRNGKRVERLPFSNSPSAQFTTPVGSGEWIAIGRARIAGQEDHIVQRPTKAVTIERTLGPGLPAPQTEPAESRPRDRRGAARRLVRRATRRAR